MSATWMVYMFKWEHVCVCNAFAFKWPVYELFQALPVPLRKYHIHRALLHPPTSAHVYNEVHRNTTQTPQYCTLCMLCVHSTVLCACFVYTVLYSVHALCTQYCTLCMLCVHSTVLCACFVYTVNLIVHIITGVSWVAVTMRNQFLSSLNLQNVSSGSASLRYICTS